MTQLDLFDSDGQCEICGDPISLDLIVDGKTVCEDCQKDMDKLDGDFSDDIDNGEQ